VTSVRASSQWAPHRLLGVDMVGSHRTGMCTGLWDQEIGVVDRLRGEAEVHNDNSIHYCATTGTPGDLAHVAV
jgi:hypothetical protein